MRQAVLFVVGSLLWVACGPSGGPEASRTPPRSTSFSQTSSGHATEEGYRITLRQGTSTLVSTVTRRGSFATQSETAKPTVPLRGAIIRYDDGTVTALDYRAHTYVTATLEATLKAKADEQSRVASGGTLPELGPVAPLPSPRLERLHRTLTVQGHPAKLFLLQDANGKTWRLAYATDLPKPSRAVRARLAQLLPGNTTRCDGDGDDDDDCEDEGEDDCRSPAQDVAGAVLLQADVQTAQGWVPAVQTVKVEKVQVSKDALAPPPGFTPAAEPLLTQAPRSTQTSATVLSGPGPVSNQPHIYHFFWGRTFAAQEHQAAVSEFSQNFVHLFGAGYFGYLAQYGVCCGESEAFHVVNDDPPGYAGSGGAGAAVGNFVLDEGLAGNGPLIWWRTGGEDPIYAVYVPESVVDTNSSFDGFHFLAPNLVMAVVPWPLSLLAHEGMPYLMVKVPDADPQGALNMPLEGVAYRQNCAAPGSNSTFCNILTQFDEWTSRASHELVEAATDPFPFWGWSDVSKVPVWYYGEISDICEFSPDPWGSSSGIASVKVDTFWSNVDNACVPESRPTLRVFSPSDGDVLPWRAGGAVATLNAYASDPLFGDISSRITWFVDGHTVHPQGGLVTSPPLSLGAHVIEATVASTLGTSAQQTLHVTVSASAPTVTISSPVDGATYGTDATLVLRGDATDPQDGALPDSALTWTVNGSAIGTGRLLTTRIPTQGPAVIALSATDSAGLSGSASVTVHLGPPTGNPTVVILQPKDGGGVLSPSDVVNFLCTATASDGSAIPAANIVWTDDVDGNIGTGYSFSRTLTGGICGPVLHHITVTATDAAGKSASDTISFWDGEIC